MKKTVFVLIFLFTSITTFAQSVNFGIAGGLNQSTVKVSLPTSQTTLSRQTGFNVGAFADFDFTWLSIQPGLYYTTKGFKDQINSSYTLPANFTGPFMTKDYVNLNYLQLPLNVLYNIPLHLGKIFIGGGPYFSYAISGNYKSTTEEVSMSGTIVSQETGTIKFGKTGEYDYTDYGLSALGGISFKNGLLFSVNFQYGIKDINNNDSYVIKNNVLGASVGYTFGKL
jgi:Outer membrane protein beta-barrel domain